MRIEIRPANLEADGDCLIEALARWLTPRSDRRRYEWLYRQSPYGAARAWLAVSEENKELVGAAAAFPRRMYVGGIEATGCVYGDFCTAPQHRSLGLALRLQRACFESTESGWAALAYDFPSASMMAVYTRLKCEQRGTFVRMARLLRADRKMKQTIKNELVARAVSRTLNAVLALQGRAASRKSSWEVALHEGLCGDEFSDLAKDLRASYRIFVARTAPYLNWRYLSHPFYRHEILTARRNGKLDGYLVFCRDGEDARIVDLFGRTENQMFGALLASACDLLRARGIGTVSAPVLAAHPLGSTLRRGGFRARESSNVVFFAGPTIPPAASSATVGDWFLMDGDRDS
jgi:GNAT superfamily N-acetyltransferase